MNEPTAKVVSYSTAHKRVGKRRGPARFHPCEGCGQQAHHWAYDHLDDNEVVGLTTGRGVKCEVTYSLNAEHYIALCRSCHTRFDRAPAAPAVFVAPVAIGSIPRRPRMADDGIVVDLRKPKVLTGRRKRCPRCEMVKDHGAYAPDRHHGGCAPRCRHCDARYVRERARAKKGTTTNCAQPLTTAQHRARALAVYGGKCVWCGSVENLQFDHVNNDGKAHRAVESRAAWLTRISRAGHRDYHWRLQLLCPPCHYGPGWKSRRAMGLPATHSDDHRQGVRRDDHHAA